MPWRARAGVAGVWLSFGSGKARKPGQMAESKPGVGMAKYRSSKELSLGHSPINLFSVIC